MTMPRGEAEGGAGCCGETMMGRRWGEEGGVSALAPQGGCCCCLVEPHLGTGRWVDISARDIAAGTWLDRRVDSSGGARRSPTCGGGGSKSGTSSERRLPSVLKKVSFIETTLLDVSV